MKASRLGVLAMMSSNCCTERGKSSSAERATLQFRPAVLTRKRNARRLIGLLAGKRVLNALHAAVVIGRSGAARPDAHRAALGLDLHADLGKIHADLVVVRAGVGDCSGSRDQRDVQAIRTRPLIPF
jgi:hypothetical protein